MITTSRLSGPKRSRGTECEAHDTNRSRWWLLFSLVPIIGIIVLIVFLVQDSDPGDNRYGPNPKQPTITPAPAV